MSSSDEHDSKTGPAVWSRPFDSLYLGCDARHAGETHVFGLGSLV